LLNLKSSTQNSSLHLLQRLLGYITQAANVRGVPYQSLTKVWLQG